MLNMVQDTGKLRVSLATDVDRDTIYRLRHAVYALELAQHPENPQAALNDSLDTFNIYITASLDEEIVGFISVTPPGGPSYSIDKYVSRNALPFAFDDTLFEIRLLTVAAPYRGRRIASVLMYAAFRWVEAHGGTRIVAIGRREVLDLYLDVGFRPLGLTIRSGAVTYEAISETTSQLRRLLACRAPLLRKLENGLDWQIGIPFHKKAGCFHGGAFFEDIGDEFETLCRSKEVINADVLDAWYPPSPKALASLREHLPWLLRTSPPTSSEGLVRTIARVRGFGPECVLPGAGSSDLIFLALRQWLTSSSRVLILDPTYGEYFHVLEQVVRCRVDRFLLSRRDGYQVDLARLEACLKTPYDLVVLVNPNSPTGRHVPREKLEKMMMRAPVSTRFWIDETYIEYAGLDQSLERFAAGSENVVVCKSMSKVYALSGARVAYLCASPCLVEELRGLTPPWAVSLPAQVAAVMALQDPDYYAVRYRETHVLRAQLAKEIFGLSKTEIIPSVTNFVLCHLPPDGPDAATVCHECRAHGLFLRDAGNMSSRLGSYALRIAVKDGETNRRIVGILTSVLYGRGASARDLKRESAWRSVST